MSAIPRPEAGEPLYPDGSSGRAALVEVGVVAAAYIVVAHAVAAGLALDTLMPAFLDEREREVGATFMAGAAAQFGLVLMLALVFRDLRGAIRNSWRLGTLPAWGAAVIAVSIHAATIALFFLDEPTRILEPTHRNLLLSLAPAPDGWSQEVFFRGYVIYRLARGGLPVSVQIAVSALLFALIHVGYVGGNINSVLWPMFGTAVLGGFLAWSVLLARGALLPAVVCHVTLIAIVQPWLALA